MKFSLVEFIRRQARAYLNDSQKAAIKKQIVVHIGGGIHEIAAEAARLTLEAERTIKEGAGAARREWVLTELKKRSGPILDKIPDSLEPFLWSLIDSALAEAISYLNVALDSDWVEKVELLEDRVFIAFELALGLDLSGDGVIGTAAPAPGQKFPGVVALLLAAGLALAGAGDASAVGRYQRLEPATDAAVEREATRYEETIAPAISPPVTNGPRYERYVASPAALEARRIAREEAAKAKPTTILPAGIGVESWIGAAPSRDGIDAGLGLMVRRGDFSIGGQAAQDRAGLALGFKRIGVNILWAPGDGWAPGVYASLVSF